MVGFIGGGGKAMEHVASHIQTCTHIEYTVSLEGVHLVMSTDDAVTLTGPYLLLGHILVWVLTSGVEYI